MMTNDTIAAIATASGKGGIGIVRLSGPKAHNIAEQLIDQPLTPRYATYTAFTDQSKINIDWNFTILKTWIDILWNSMPIWIVKTLKLNNLLENLAFYANVS